MKHAFFLSTFALSILTADISNIPMTSAEFQAFCTQKFVHRSHPDAKKNDEICTYRETECKDGLLMRLSWLYAADVEVRSLSWIPPTVSEMNLVEMPVAAPLEARALPRSLLLFRAKRCSIEGSIDLSGLPPKIVQIHLRGNQLVGVVSLLRLPPKLVVVDLSFNRVEKIFYDIERLPKGFVVAYFLTAKAKNIPAKNVGVAPDTRTAIRLQGLFAEQYIEWAGKLHQCLYGQNRRRRS